MSDTKHKYYCYFIIDVESKMVHIDISYAKDAQAILRKHLRGEVPCTKKRFGLGPQQIIPQLHMRPAKYRTKADAEEEAAGWRYYFAEEGYQLIPATDGTNATSLSYRAQRVLSENEHRTVYGVLLDRNSKNYHSKHRISTKPSTLQKHTLEPANTILSFRVTPSAAEAFEEIFTESGYTKGQLFAEMIDDYTGETSLFSDDLRGRLFAADAEIRRLRAENAELIRKHNQKLNHVRKQKTILQQMTRNWSKHIPTQGKDGNLIPIYSRKKGRRLIYNRSEYRYPAEDGTELIKIDCMQYGRSAKHKGQAVFIYGQKENKEKIKLRCYYRRDFTGCYPPAKEFRRRNLVWQVGYIRSPDGAMNLIGAIPLAPSWITSKKETPHNSSPYLTQRDLGLNDNAFSTEKTLAGSRKLALSETSSAFDKVITNAIQRQQEQLFCQHQK